MSRTLDGKPLHIEVKSTKGGLDEPFYISAPELAKANEVECKGELYMIYRVPYSLEPERRYVIPMSMQEFREKYVLEAENYKVLPKRVLEMLGLEYYRIINGYRKVDIAKRLGISETSVAKMKEAESFRGPRFTIENSASFIQ